MKVFLTGGTGFIGQPLTQALLAQGWEVTVLVRKPQSPQAQALAALGARLAPGDVTDPGSLRAPMAGADLVIHNAGHFELGLTAEGRRRMEAINQQGTRQVLGMALELGIPRTVYVSSVVWFGDTGPELRDESFRRTQPYRYYYEQSKSEAHDIALDFQQRGLPLIIVCPSQVIGPNDHSVWGYFTRLYLNGWMPPVAWAADLKVVHTHVEDIASGIALAGARGRTGETYLLAGEATSVREVASYWASRPGGMRVRLYVPAWLALPLFAPMAPLLRMLGLPAFISSETVRAAFWVHMSGAKAQRELGWSFRPAREAWLSLLDEEIRLRRQPGRKGLAARLRPLEQP
ncbi:MAG: NAD-dependent epimerase/dehydratase family protein [Bacteroidia bacterium]|nr:NAD-dependent epimerase/dehydratase family protein [Bacteroidia bacterium]